MRILNVNHSLDLLDGGTAERTRQMSRFLSRHGHDVTILITDKGLNRDVVESLRPCRIVALRCLNKRFYLPKYSPKLIKKIVAESDIIHLMGHWGILNALVYRAARQVNK